MSDDVVTSFMDDPYTIIIGHNFINLQDKPSWFPGASELVCSFATSLYFNLGSLNLNSNR